MVARPGQRTVLLVEDNPGDARLIAESLRDAGDSVRLESVETLSDALVALSSRPIDAVILDLGLPDSQGIETFTRLREAYPRVATIVLSGDSDTETALRTVQQGAQDFLIKGHVDGETLVRCIGYAIERERVEWSLRESEERLRDSLDVSESVAELSRVLVSETQTLEEIAQLTLHSAMALTSSPHGYVSLVDPSTRAHSLVAASDMMRGGLAGADASLASALSASPDGTYPHLWGVSLNTSEPFLTNEPSIDPRSGGTPDGHLPVTCLLSVPVTTSKGVVGQIAVANAPEGYTLVETEKLQRLASLYGMAIVQHEEHEELRRSESELRSSNEQQAQMILDVAEVMGGIIETRDPYTQGHQVRVADIAYAIATEMGLSGDDLDCIRMAGLLHDVGKLSVPSEILSKPGALSDTEFALIKEHPVRGHDILAKIAFPWPIADIVLQHHERCDGSGYPGGLRADETMLPAKIIAVADVLEAMSSYRPYRAALGAKEAFDEIVSHPDKYCPEVVRAVVALNGRGELGL
jgi:putative nucleotidyltransferase with HDIG domain